MVDSTVFVVDDEQDVRNLLRDYLEAVGLKVHTFASAAEFLAAYNPENQGCLLLDISMPDMGGIELLETLNTLGNTTPVIFLTGAGTVENAVKALKAGALDFIEKPMVMAELLTCVKQALDLDLKLRSEASKALQIVQRFEQLTTRERQVMSSIIEGNSNKEIARILDISSRTVEVHRQHVIEKMQADSIADLVKMGLALQL